MRILINDPVFIFSILVLIGLVWISREEYKESKKLKNKIKNFPRVRSNDEREIFK